MGIQLPPYRATALVIFGPCLLWSNGCMHQYITWYGGRPQPRRHCVTLSLSSTCPKGAHPQFSTHVRCGQMAGWSKMLLGMKVGLSAGYCIWWALSSPPEKKVTAAIHSVLGPSLLWPRSPISATAQPLLDFFGRLLLKRFALCYGTVVCLSITLVYCGQTAGQIKVLFGKEVGHGWGVHSYNCTSCPHAKGIAAPTFTQACVRKPWPKSILTKRLHG